jgi:ubiquinone/menaquinone biosynthesis C-methylase UbiE
MWHFGYNGIILALKFRRFAGNAQIDILMYSKEPIDKNSFTRDFDLAYSKFAAAYDWAVKNLPVWKKWISTAIPHIMGPNVLEVSIGTGFLISQYANQFHTFGIDYNWELTCIARENLRKSSQAAAIQQADVAYLPYPPASFDTVVNTMAFSGYPDGSKALSEIHRVLKPDGGLIMVDINYPKDKNWLGSQMTRCWMQFGDIIRDMHVLFRETNFEFTEEEIGAFGSVHLYIARKKKSNPKFKS